MDEKLLALPWQIQVALGSGYAAYLIAYSGIREHHNAAEVTFRSIAFGMVATIVLASTQQWKFGWSLFAAFACSVVAGVIWRKYGMSGLKWIMRESDVSWADDTPTAWQTITVCNSKHAVSQISVELEDGRWLRCLNTTPVKDLPFGPLKIGSNGDVALYVDAETSPDGTEVDVGPLVADYWGARITYVPAARIRRVMIRHHLG